MTTMKVTKPARKRGFQQLPPADEILAAFTYDAEAGQLLHKRTWGRSRAGLPAGTPDKQGMVVVGLNGRHYYLQELIWLLHTGAPSKYVHHRDGDKTNNHISNLFSLPDNAENLRREDVLALFHYDRDAGTLTRRVSYSQGSSGSQGVRVNGYLKHTILRKQLGVHQLVWLIETSRWPEDELDHINGVRHDNRIENLRQVDRGENSRNMPLHPRNKTGTSGVWYDRRFDRYEAYITKGGVRTRLGRFANEQDAIDARRSAEKALGFHPNHGRTREARAETP